MIDLTLILSQVDDPDLRAFLDLATSPESRWAKLQTLIRKDKRWKYRMDDLMALKKDGAHDAYLLDFIINDLDLKFAGMKINSQLLRSMLPAPVVSQYEAAFSTALQLYAERVKMDEKPEKVKKLKGRKKR